MYNLTLTNGERRAIDFAGYRYPEGDDLQRILWHDCAHPTQADGEYVEWESADDITFTMPEGVAWTVRDLLEGDDSNYGAALFADEFRQKLINFCGRIV